MAALCRSALHPHHVLRFRALLVLNDLKLHGLPFGQRLESITSDRRKVDKYVRSTFLLNEPETLLIIEPFHCSACHILFTSSGDIAGMLLDRKFTVGRK